MRSGRNGVEMEESVSVDTGQAARLYRALKVAGYGPVSSNK